MASAFASAPNKKNRLLNRSEPANTSLSRCHLKRPPPSDRICRSLPPPHPETVPYDVLPRMISAAMRSLTSLSHPPRAAFPPIIPRAPHSATLLSLHLIVGFCQTVSILTNLRRRCQGYIRNYHNPFCEKSDKSQNHQQTSTQTTDTRTRSNLAPKRLPSTPPKHVLPHGLTLLNRPRRTTAAMSPSAVQLPSESNTLVSPVKHFAF